MFGSGSKKKILEMYQLLPGKAKAAATLVPIFLSLVFISGAHSQEIAKPLFLKTGYSLHAGGPAKRILRGDTPSGLPAQFLVIKKRKIKDVNWVAVRLPRRPNKSIGWIREEKLLLRKARGKLFLSLRHRTLAFFLNGKRVWRTQVVIGKESTPTPRGLFALYDRHRAFDNLRPWVFETTAHSRVLRTFQGSPARIALHGRHDSLWAPWGSASSNGCIRTPDWALRSLRRKAPLGTSIRIR